MRKSKLALLGGSGAALVAGFAAVVLLATATAAPNSSGTASAAAQSKGKGPGNSNANNGNANANNPGNGNNGGNGNGNNGNGNNENGNGNGGNGGGNGNNGNGGGNGNGGNGNAATPPGKKLVVTASVAGLVAPGVPAVLNVKVDNPNNQPVNLKSVAAAVTSVTSAGGATPVCDKAWYSIGSFTGSRPIARNSSTSLELPVTFTSLPGVNQDNCKGATYSFTFTANADQA